MRRNLRNGNLLNRAVLFGSAAFDNAFMARSAYSTQGSFVGDVSYPYTTDMIIDVEYLNWMMFSDGNRK